MAYPNSGGTTHFGGPRVSFSLMTAPIRIDVGGTIYTSCLRTLTAFPQSRISKMFTGEIPIAVDTLQKNFFIDRDGVMFRHILNFLRFHQLIIPLDFPDIDLLEMEAIYFELTEMVECIFQFRFARIYYCPRCSFGVFTAAQRTQTAVLYQHPQPNS